MSTTTTTQRLHIALVSTEYPPAYGGGIGTCVALLARGLVQRGHEVTVVTPGDPPSEEVRDGGVRVRRVAHARRDAAGEPARTLEAWWAWSQRAAEVVLEVGADVAEFPDYRAEAAALLARRGAGGPAVAVRLHTPLAVLAKYNAARARRRTLETLEIETILAADAVVSSSAALTGEVRALVPELGDVELARYGLDPHLIDDAAPVARATGEADAVYIGRLEERKGVTVLARAAGEFLRRSPGSVLHLVGGDTEWGPGEPSTRRIVEDLIDAGVRARVRFHGALPPAGVRAMVRGAAVCVFPSLFEAGPYACLEAMALGRAVVGTGSGGMAEMIEDGVSGRLCRAGDAADLARVVGEVLAMPAEARSRMGAAARQRIAERYPVARSAEETEAAYRRVLHRRAQGAAPPAPPGLAAVLAGREGRESAMAAEVQAAGAELTRLAAGWEEQARRIKELDEHVARIWAELRAACDERDRWHDEAQRLARAWEALSAELREASLEAGRLRGDLLTVQGERAALIDRVSRLERAVSEAERRPVFRILARAGLVSQIGRGPGRARDGGAAS